MAASGWSRPMKFEARGASLVLVLLALFVVFSLTSDRFFHYDNMANLLLQSSVTGLAAIGLTFVILTAGIDLSGGSIMNLALVVAISVGGTAGAIEYTTDTNWLVYPVALAAGAILGIGNAAGIILLRLNPLIVTLATMVLYRGIALHATGGREVLVMGAVRDFGRGDFLATIGLPVVAMIVLALSSSLFLRHITFGRFVLGVGGSERSARENGLPVRRVLIFAYAFAGFSAALAGLVLVGRVGAVNPDLGWQFEFTVITAVVLGGTNLLGGSGTVWGSVLAAIVLTTISNGLNLIGADPFLYDVIRGVVLLLAVVLDTATSNRRRRQVATGKT